MQSILARLGHGGQSAPIFGLAYLLGIQLMPRIRNWKELHFYRPDKASRYQHIDTLLWASTEPGEPAEEGIEEVVL